MERNTSGVQIPVDAVDADQLPRRSSIKYDNICKLVGSIVIENNQNILAMEEHYTSIIDQLKEKLTELLEENNNLKQVLNNGHNAVADSSGTDKVSRRK